jgi:hypothetical protein
MSLVQLWLISIERKELTVSLSVVDDHCALATCQCAIVHLKSCLGKIMSKVQTRAPDIHTAKSAACQGEHNRTQIVATPMNQYCLTRHLSLEAHSVNMKGARLSEQETQRHFPFKGQQERAAYMSSLVDGPGFEPGTSTMPTLRSCQTDLPAQPFSL